MVNGHNDGDNEEMRDLNGDTPPDEMAGEPTGPVAVVNGIHPTGRETGQPTSFGDLAGIAMGQQHGGNPAFALLTFPQDIAEWGSRSDLRPDQVMAMYTLSAEDYALQLGNVPWQRQSWLLANLVNSIGGTARRQFMEVLGAIRDRNFVGGMMDRFGGMFGFGNKQEGSFNQDRAAS